MSMPAESSAPLSRHNLFGKQTWLEIFWAVTAKRSFKGRIASPRYQANIVPKEAIEQRHRISNLFPGLRESPFRKLDRRPGRGSFASVALTTTFSTETSRVVASGKQTIDAGSAVYLRRLKIALRPMRVFRATLHPKRTHPACEGSRRCVVTVVIGRRKVAAFKKI